MERFKNGDEFKRDCMGIAIQRRMALETHETTKEEVDELIKSTLDEVIKEIDEMSNDEFLKVVIHHALLLIGGLSSTIPESED